MKLRPSTTRVRLAAIAGALVFATLALAPSAQAAELVTTKWSCNGGPVFTITTTPQATSLIRRIYPTVGCRQVG
ncbi:hypothetical protein [Streptomyces sp. 900105245]